MVFAAIRAANLASWARCELFRGLDCLDEPVHSGRGFKRHVVARRHL